MVLWDRSWRSVSRCIIVMEKNFSLSHADSWVSTVQVPHQIALYSMLIVQPFSRQSLSTTPYKCRKQSSSNSRETKHFSPVLEQNTSLFFFGLFRLWCVVVNPCFIYSNESLQKLGWIAFKHVQNHSGLTFRKPPNLGCFTRP